MPRALPRAPVAAEGPALGQPHPCVGWWITHELVPGCDNASPEGLRCPPGRCSKIFWVSAPERPPCPGRGPGEPTLGLSQLTTGLGSKWGEFLKKQGFAGKPQLVPVELQQVREQKSCSGLGWFPQPRNNWAKILPSLSCTAGDRGSSTYDDDGDDNDNNHHHPVHWEPNGAESAAMELFVHIRCRSPRAQPLVPRGGTRGTVYPWPPTPSLCPRCQVPVPPLQRLLGVHSRAVGSQQGGRGSGVL